jgi:hypothetical protein
LSTTALSSACPIVVFLFEVLQKKIGGTRNILFFCPLEENLGDDISFTLVNQLEETKCN